MKWVLNILGVILILIGAIWLFQGINILPGSVMSGHPVYAVLGIILGAIGVVLMVYNNRRSKAAATENRNRMER